MVVKENNPASVRGAISTLRKVNSAVRAISRIRAEATSAGKTASSEAPKTGGKHTQELRKTLLKRKVMDHQAAVRRAEDAVLESAEATPGLLRRAIRRQKAMQTMNTMRSGVSSLHKSARKQGVKWSLNPIRKPADEQANNQRFLDQVQGSFRPERKKMGGM